MAAKDNLIENILNVTSVRTSNTNESVVERDKDKNVDREKSKEKQKKQSNASGSGKTALSSSKERDDSFAQLCSIMKEAFVSLQNSFATLGTEIAEQVTAGLTEGQTTQEEASEGADTVAGLNDELLFEAISK